ncbi:capsule biosynthesis protein CapA [Planococcus antarcticus DSM 14505]|uniref:Capsular biosynthesis protein n=1 Tax=Planococcus antarcticus DSM 14505 TaxID=1185653 RepID=A0A1C7DKB9_9BACL|nr:CapA family protein [Planococcus antarcticus]ANU11832.1 capsular biosynthesis protein [Planococcus antarcticus DSM 14505]EIM06935.1 capsule biosynthesis protein CapA [Planococcus antarcticus DSM 14505]
MNPLRKPVFLLLVAATLLLAGCAIDTVTVAEEQQPIVFESRELPVATSPSELSVTRSASLSAVGDILIHERVYRDAQAADGYNFTPMLQRVTPFLETADITIANSESIIGGSEIGLSSYPSFNSPYEVGDALKDAGVDVVTLANNHTLDRGIPAIENAIHYWDQIGMIHTGSYLSADDRSEITLITRNDITFSFLSYTYGTNGIQAPAGKDYLVNRIDPLIIQQDLKRARDVSDVVILSLHFGEEYQKMPNAEQIELAQFSAKNGADVILGHHPHVLQPPEWISTKDGRKAFVIYSLGNFLSGQDELDRQIGAILHLDVKKETTANSSTITLQNPAFTTTFVRSANSKDYEMDLLKNVDSNLNVATKAHLSTWIEDLQFIE